MTTHLLLVGGFLGAGKTTLLLKAAQHLVTQGYCVGMVTNDQARGCFCCRFPDLLASVKRLQESIRPDIILCEPVGSCTDLISTIFRPLYAYYPTEFRVAPLTVLVDPFREPKSFPQEVGYIYEKQLSEANLIVVSKKDLLNSETTQAHLQDLQQSYPAAQALAVSAQKGEGLQDWLEICLQQSSNIEQVLEMNYQTYAQGEAYLAWLNAHGLVSSALPFSASAWMASIFQGIEQACQVQGAAIAHVKMHVTTETQVLKGSLTQLGRPMSWDLGPTDEKTTQAHFLLNVRVTTTPKILETLIRQVLTQVVGQMGTHLEMTDLACFSPLPPRPTYRLLSL
ncbi:MAG: hypothetical protein E6J34_14720 [Chloroflexi bacterium]|nr:MAG: hypothetical protein E6J34_14720 [Chloroflexota bacterium]